MVADWQGVHESSVIAINTLYSGLLQRFPPSELDILFLRSFSRLSVHCAWPTMALLTAGSVRSYNIIIVVMAVSWLAG